MAATLEDSRADLLDRLCGLATAFVSAGEAPGIADFIRHYYAEVGLDDLESRRAEDLAGAARAHWRLAQRREPGVPIVRVSNPAAGADGWQSPHTVVEIVGDDMPFLVDSVGVELERHDLAVQLVVHPVVVVRRDERGGLLGIGEPGASGSVAESFLHFEVERTTDAAELASLHDDLLRVLGDVDAATTDWPAMLRRVAEIAESLEQDPPPEGTAERPAEERAAAVALLRWMADDHFMFTGYREYSLRDTQGSDVLTAVPGTGLGILRDQHDVPGGDAFSRPPPELRRRADDRALLVLTKGSTQSTVHRCAYLDQVGVKQFDEHGTVCGERRFVGLYTSEAYHSNPRDIPLLRDKVDAVIARAGFAPRSHSARDLLAVLENYPRDELFQASTDELFETAMGILQLEERRRVRLFVRHDPYGRFVSCLVYLPRDKYTTALRLKITALLHQAFRATGEDYQALVSESVLARLHIVLRTVPGFASDVPVDEIEAAVAAATRSWGDELHDALAAAHGEEQGRALHRRYGDAFPAAYTDETAPAAALADIACLEHLPARPDLAIRLARTDDTFVLTLVGAGAPIVLSEIMPLLQNMGVSVVEERPYRVAPRGGTPAWIERFVLRPVAPGVTLDPDGPGEKFQEALAAVVRSTAENDSFNTLVLAAGLAWREVTVLRAYSHYLRQAGTPFSQDYIAAALIAHPDLARGLVTLFRERFDPVVAYPGANTDADTARIAELTTALDAVTSLDDDRILRALLRLVLATRRTNAYNGVSEAPIAFKLDPTGVPELPKPLPMFEIFVASPRVEGVHLRAGRVARGGIRWSDRREDFRTEILGLMKAQTVKNAVIVPVGAKGGFVVKRPPADRDALALEVVACYQSFIGALLELTDNLVDGRAVPPAGMIRYDGDDPYLVVAADKGTATFSDVANALAVEHHFWLGDAFASGGSVGFDHKAMGITARGAWESVKVHFRSLGIDVQSAPVTAVGIGDMSGDVFGNGMLLSHGLRLVAAFDHRHVFLDPDPDPERSYAERARLFALRRSSWDDYDRTVLSEGGGIYPRSLKAIPISDAVRDRLGITATTLPSAELISAILRAPVDLLWNGGIGTYVKATGETHAEVGDKTNDGLRVNAAELRCKVVGEGGNLGFTQRARVEFALGGGRINTDAIDNSAGVDTSDHEVNIKILLDGVVASGKLGIEARNALLDEMTDEVAALVLADNVSQNQTLTTARFQALPMAGVHERLMQALAARGRLDRELEFLPDKVTLAARVKNGSGLTVPELAVLLAYSKITLEEDLRDSTLLDDPDVQSEISGYFPVVLRDRYAVEIGRHPLRREIIATRIVNAMVNRAGSTFAFRIAEETGARADDVVRAHIVASRIFDEDTIARDIDALDGVVEVDTQCEMRLELRKLVERSSRWLVRYRPRPLPIAATVAELASGVATCAASMPPLLRGGEHDWLESFQVALTSRGVPEPLAARLAGLESLVGALDVVDLSLTSGRPISEILGMWCAVGDRLRLDWLRDRILDDLPRDDRWHALARSALRDDLSNERRALVSSVLTFAPGSPVDDALDGWIAQHPGITHAMSVLDDLQKEASFDVATLSVALRELRNLSQGELTR